MPGVSESGDVLVQAFVPEHGLAKTAATDRMHPEIRAFVEGLKSDKSKLYVLVNALGAGEFYGSNINGDYFEEAELSKDSDLAGYKTFLKSGVYRHHQNKDTERSMGKVVCAVYNWTMHRVELVIEIDRAKAREEGHQDLVDQLDAGKNPAVSMGCRVKYDVCRICGNKSKTRADYCFVPGTRVSMADGTRRAIEDVQVGDLVLSATGLPTRVTALLPSVVDECLVVLRTSANGMTLRVTEAHPILSSPREAFSCYYRTTQPGTRSCFPGTLPACTRCQRVSPVPTFVESGNLRKDDTVYAPAVLPDPSAVVPALSPEDAYVVGLFMAEGSYAKQQGKRSSVQFSLHRDEVELVAAIQAFTVRRGARAAKVYPAGRNGISVRIHSQETAEFFFDLCGEYAASKRASPALVNQPDEIVGEYLRGLWDGDGHISARKTGYSRLNSASEDLVWQTAGLLRRLGNTSYVGVALVPGGPTKRTNVVTQWYVQTDYGTGQPRKSTALEGTRQLSQVVGVRREHYCGPLHNFETEDHTYVAEGLAVHNCIHAKTMMNQILPSGQKVCVANPNCRFFDLSFVVIGADRTSYAMAKVARVMVPGGVVLSADLAEQWGLRDRSDVYRLTTKLAERQKLSNLMKRIPAMSARVVKPISDQEQSLPDHVLDRLARYPLKRALTTCSAAGIVLKPAEYQRLVLAHMGQKGRADRLAKQGMVFRPSGRPDTSVRFGDPQDYDTDVRDLLRPYLADRSLFDP
ncbi:MAG: LAGLIDADG family homing endonuclease, partial [Candidatus Bipolaricaulota bacterium]